MPTENPKKIYTLPEAAKLAGVSEDELRCAIKDGLLQAQFLQNTGEYHLANSELDLYMRRSRNVPLTTGLRKRRVLIIDDLLATGGTAACATTLVRESGATVVAAGFVIELTFLDGRAKLDGTAAYSLIEY